MANREQLISSLVDDLSVKPKKQLPIFAVALLWWLASWLYVVIATLVMGPLRATASHEIADVHHFQIESLVGLIASFLIALAAWYGSVPGALTRRLLTVGLVTAVAWVSFYIVGLSEPAIEPAMHGKREYCYLEAFVYSFPPTAVACYFITKRYPLKLLQTGLMAGLAAGIMPALFMQFACMYDPEHILTHHILPGIANAGIGTLVLFIIRHYMSRNAAH
ncbi:MAG: NrsF family protein [Cellvibrionaceae bacterium]